MRSGLVRAPTSSTLRRGPELGVMLSCSWAPESLSVSVNLCWCAFPTNSAGY